MDNIDPKNLGPKVYEENQCITRQDLEHAIKAYESVEAIYAMKGLIQPAEIAHVSHMVMEQLIKWLEDGKPPLIEENKDSGKD